MKEGLGGVVGGHCPLGQQPGSYQVSLVLSMPLWVTKGHLLEARTV